MIKCGMKLYPFPNFNSATETVEVWEWISNFIPDLTGCVYLSMLGLDWIHLSKRGPWQVFRTWTIDYMPQNSMACNYLYIHSFMYSLTKHDIINNTQPHRLITELENFEHLIKSLILFEITESCTDNCIYRYTFCIITHIFASVEVWCKS